MILLLLILSVLLSGSFCAGDNRVKFAAVLYRHGDRTPVKIYPTDPWRNESLWPVRFGELTNKGKQQHYALGQWLRKRYTHLLSSNFDPTEIYVRSTDVDRTLMSAQANLAGMYPPVNTSVWNMNLMWQPIPVHTVPELEDEILSMKKPCPAYNKELKKVISSKAYKERLMKYQKLMDYLSTHTGMKVKDYNDINDIYNVLYIETLYNFTLPEWTNKVYPDAMAEPAGYSFTIDTSSPVLARLRAGPFLKQVTSKMLDALDDEISSSDKRHPKVLIYSGHDLTVGSVLNALGLFNDICPPYTATVFLELIQDNEMSEPLGYLRISYRNSTEIVEPYVLNIPYCGELCPLLRFMKIYENLISVNWDYECEKQFPALVVSLLLSFYIGLALFATIYISHRIHFVRVSRQHRLNMVYTRLHAPSATPTPTPCKQLDDV